MRKYILLVLFSLVFLLSADAQYGNEWIDFDKTYYKFKIASDGIYRIPQEVLANAGLSGIPGSQFRLYRLGEEVAVFTSTEGVFAGTDFIEFYGLQNRGELDRALFQNPDTEQLNPDFSMFSDTSTYFLTWDDNGSGLRIEGIGNDLSNPPAPETFYMHEEQWVYADHAVDPWNATESAFISLSRYQEAEGFARAGLTSFLLDIPATLISSNGPDAILDVRLASNTRTAHQITSVFAGDTLLNNANEQYFNLYQINKTLQASSLGSSQLLDIKDLVPEGRFAISSVHWRYPRQYDFTGRSSVNFIHPANGTAQYFELHNFVSGNEGPVVYDLTSRVRLVSNKTVNSVQFLLPGFSGERDIVISAQEGIHTITNLTERTFTDFTSDNTEYIIITHPTLRSGSDIVNQYAQYRNSAIGGAYNTGIYSILDLYDQFGYGIEKHPQAIRNFNKLIQDQWDAAKMVFIIGKGITYTISRSHGSNEEEHLLVPTFGNPGADNLLFTPNGISQPPFPVGRLPISSADQLQTYLSKIIEYDQVSTLPQTIADRGWTKHILHLGGGTTSGEQGQIRSYLNQMENNAANTAFGADVSTFTKSSTNEVSEVSNSERILDILEQGVSIVKFFGHSSASTLDFQINNPRVWNNKGKYPIFSAMGCRSGDIHQNYLSLSENFVFEPDAGVIAFLAGSGSQYITSLGSWGRNWYLTFGQGVNSMTLGETVVQSLTSLNQFGSLSHILLIEQQTLNGDPAIRFYATPGPDFVLDYASARYSPEVLTVNDDVFTLSCDVVNIGTNLPDSARVVITQKFPDGHLETVYSEIVGVRNYRTTLNFPIPISPNSSGLNSFYIKFDSDNVIEELPDPEAEQNNMLISEQGVEGINIFILDNRSLATYPLEFAIVTESLPELIASSTNAFSKGQTFVMEIDTTAEFNSPLKIREFFSQFGGVIKWKPILSYLPGHVYYWRVSTDSVSQNQGYIWDESSFLYQPGGERGWNQSHYYQFLKDDFDGIHVNEQRQFAFLKGVQNIWVQNAVDTAAFERFKFFINNENFISQYRQWRPYEAHVFVTVFDPITGERWRNPIGGAYGAINPFVNDRPVFPFSTATPESRNNLMTFVEDIIPSGYFVALYTYQRTGYNEMTMQPFRFLDYYPEQWAADSLLFGRNIFSMIEGIHPESKIRSLQNGSVPYTILFQKDGPVFQEQVALNYDETTNADANFTVVRTSGAANSTLVGPASSWSEVQWAYSEKENHDSILISVYAVRIDNTDTLIADRTTQAIIDLSGLDAEEYPYVRLLLYSSDTSALRSAPQLDFWRVLFEGRPEFVFNPAQGFEFHHDSIRLGDTLHFKTIVENVSPYPAEAFTVGYTIFDAMNNMLEIVHVVPPLASGGSAVIELYQSITDHSGDHHFLAELNRDRLSAEIHHYNNFGLHKFYVLADAAKPVLDVTFDGRHLFDGDVVSTNPEIVITLLDDNNFFPITDKDHFEVFIRTPLTFDFEQLDLASPEFTFIPSDPGNENVNATLVWRPEFLEDGYYSFEANARDASNNKPDVPYEINFEVLGDARIVNLKVIPNPFSDVAHFSFVLTGHTSPQSFTIDITDVSGRIVRRLDETDLGMVYVGSHHRDLIWDGRGENGAPVPGGIYFYRIEAKRQDGSGYIFDRPNGGVGKIILIR